MSSRDRPRDDDLEERLDELEAVLSELRADLRASERDRGLPGSSDPRRGTDSRRERAGSRGTEPPRSLDLPRPPRLSELVRFTEQYTIPTVIALLETTITSLKLAQGTLRLFDPERDVRGDAESTAGRLADVRDGAADGLVRSLSELRTALAEADLPEEAASRSIIEDARDLTAEIEARIEESRHERDTPRNPDREDRTGRKESRRDGAVHIDVTDPGTDPEERAADAAGTGSEENGPTDPDDDRPEVDVESELDSIKRQLDAVENGEDAEADGLDDPSSDDASADGSSSDGSSPDDSAG